MTTANAMGEYCGACGKLVYVVSFGITAFTKDGKAWERYDRRFSCGHRAVSEYPSACATCRM